ncbi:hypothetical protein ASPZODRAFT_42453, partial [Penicilliopsis zonata CBS 506.65]
DHHSGLHHSLSTASLPRRTPSFRALMAGPNSSAGSLSPASLLSSPQLAAIGDLTPLPSPVNGLSPWRTIPRSDSQLLSRSPSGASRSGSSLSLRASDLAPSTSRSRMKPYPGLDKLGEESSPTTLDTSTTTPVASSSSSSPSTATRRHSRNRSLSEYVPPARSVPLHPRPVAVSGTGPSSGIVSSSSTDSTSNTNALHREQYLAVQRGITIATARPPTPPRSAHSGSEATDDDEPVIRHHPSQNGVEEIYSVRSIRTNQPRKYRKLRQLGQGTFSQVSLAVRIEAAGERNHSHHHSSHHYNHHNHHHQQHSNGVPKIPSSLPPKLVAVKIIESGPAGGADEERVEVSLKREVDILKSVNHPSLVQLKAFGSDEKRALLVLDYCPGGDLFDFASSGLKPMSPALIRRIFAELVAAVRYLHSHFIVHRDIKLENVLVTLPPAAMEKITDWRTYDRAVVTLSDLGLSRRIPEPPESALLQTRCGSEDYAAPEILMGQPYDGRSTDAWALGVLLYAMMENRLPFDVLPGTRGDPAKLRARTVHRIARLEWSWYRFADADGDWDPAKGAELEAARECVEGLLKRNTRRKTLGEIAALDWVREAIDVPTGLKRGDQEVP